MGYALRQFLSGAWGWFVLGLVVASLSPAQGENAAQPPPAGESPPGAGAPQELTALDGGSLQPGITVERQGRLLVLTYGSKPGSGVLSSGVDPGQEPPGFVVYRGQRPIAVGQFEYG
jgi:hypothetical protein